MTKALLWIGGATLATVLLFGGALVLAILQSLGFAPWFGVNTFPDFSYFGALWGSSTFWVSLGLTLYYATVSTVIALILGIEGADQEIAQFGVDRLDRFQDALSEIAILVAIAQFHRLVRAGRCARRDGGASEAAIFQQDVDLHSRIAAAVEDFASVQVDNGCHGWRLRSEERSIADPLCIGTLPRKLRCNIIDRA